SGALPIECDVANMKTGDVIDIHPYAGKITRHGTDELVCEFSLKTDIILDEVQAGGRIPLIIGRGLTDKARAELGMGPSPAFRRPAVEQQSSKGFTLAQKIVGRACGVAGIRPGTYCE